MESEAQDIRQLASRLQLYHFRAYLTDRGWKEGPSRYVDHVYFQVDRDDGGGSYDLYLPATPDVPKHRTRQMRAIYKLCGIEDREPEQITRDLLASKESRPERPGGQTIRLRLANNGSKTLRIEVASPPRQYELMPDEAIELKCDAETIRSLNIECDDSSITIATANR